MSRRPPVCTLRWAGLCLARSAKQRPRGASEGDISGYSEEYRARQRPVKYDYKSRRERASAHRSILHAPRLPVHLCAAAAALFLEGLAIPARPACTTPCPPALAAPSSSITHHSWKARTASCNRLRNRDPASAAAASGELSATPQESAEQQSTAHPTSHTTPRRARLFVRPLLTAAGRRRSQRGESVQRRCRAKQSSAALRASSASPATVV